jgi:lysophospholipase L1-like esterase
MKSGRLRLLGLIVMAVGCGGRAPAVQPTQVPDPPSMSCPADIALIFRTGQPQPTATYDAPAAQHGQLPVNVVCTPASGSEFPNGSTTVTCVATDALARKASCTFGIVVAPVPRLEKTKFLAFGDSITEGKVGGGLSAGVILPGNYAERLATNLRGRYEEQTISMVNEGFGGERTGDGKWRLGPVLNQARPEVLLLLEGTNDMLGDQSGAAITSTVEALQHMVQQGKLRGMRVLLGTLPPLKQAALVSRAAVEAVPMLNARIATMAATENVTLVDLYAAVPQSQIGTDGKHPTPEGHQTIADTFFSTIVSTLELKTPAPLQTFGPVRGIR